MTSPSKPLRITSWILQLVAAGILLQTLFFKFTGAPESIHIFTEVGAEPWGRYASGIAELIAGVLLLIPGLAACGGLLAAAVMLGAIGAHLGPLGIAIEIDGKSDGGSLFALALVTFACSVAVVVIRRSQLGPWLRRLRPAED